MWLHELFGGNAYVNKHLKWQPHLQAYSGFHPGKYDSQLYQKPVVIPNTSETQVSPKAPDSIDPAQNRKNTCHKYTWAHQ